VKLRLSTFSRPPALDAAERDGLFAAEGLEIDVARATGSAAQLASLLAGELDLVHTAADNVLARLDAGERDLRIYLVAELGVDLRLVARGVTSIGELAGRRLGVDAAWSGHALLLYAVLERAGVRRGDHEAVALGSSAHRAAALREGRIDAALLSPPHDAAAITEGAVVLAECYREFPRHPGLTVAARPSWAARNGDALVGYLRALIAGQRTTGSAVPAIEAQRASLRGALDLRRSVTGGPAGTDDDITRAFDPAYALRAEPALA